MGTHHRRAAARFRQNLADAARAECDRAGERRIERGSAARAWRDGPRAVIGEEIDAAVQRHRRAAVDHAVLSDILAGHGDVGFRSFDQAGIERQAALRIDGTDINIEPTQARIRRIMGGEGNLVSGRQDGLAVRGGDRAIVGHVGPDERNFAADVFRIGQAGQLSAGLHDHISVEATGGRGGRISGGVCLDDGARCRCRGSDEGRRGTVAAGHLIDLRKEKLVVGIIEQAAADEVIIDRQARGDQRANVDLRRSAEKNAVLIDDVHLARRLDGAQDIGGSHIGRDLVDRHPLADVGATGTLVEIEQRVFPDVERLPGQ